MTPFAEVQTMASRLDALAISAGFGGFQNDVDTWQYSVSGGEIRNYLRIRNGEYVLTRAQRAETNEQLLFASSSLLDVEKYLTFYFCGAYRSGRLPRLLVVPIPVTNDKVAPGFTLMKDPADGWILRDGATGEERKGDDTELVKFSHYVRLPVDEIRESALDLEGKPHFSVSRRSS